MKKKFILAMSVVLLLIMITVTCVACSPNAESIKKKVEAKGYAVDYYTADLGNDENVAQVLYAYKDEGIDGPALIVYWYFNDKDAKKAYDEYSQEFEGYWTVVKKGKAVAMGVKELCDLV